MLGALIEIFAAATAWLIGFLPAGPDSSAGPTDLIRGAVGFVKALDVIVPIDVELAAIGAIVIWLIAKASFRGTVWAYKRILK